MIRRALLIACALPALTMSVLAQDALPEPPAGIERVLVVSIDGLRPDALDQVESGNLHALAERGAVDWAAQTVVPTSTLPAHVSMLTGLAVEVHGVDYDDPPEDCPPLEAPTLLTLAADAGYETALVVGKLKFCVFQQDDRTQYHELLYNDAAITAQVIAHIEDGVDVIVAHLPGPDAIGHVSGWMNEPYIEAVQASDEFIGQMLAALEANDLVERTLVIVTSDHGGHDLHHREGTPEDRTMPFVVAGPGVAAGTLLHDVTVTRTAPTVLWALGIPLPTDSAPPLLDAFTGIGGDTRAEDKQARLLNGAAT